MTNYITDEVKALIGFESEWEVACDVVERGQIRRHAQGIMDKDPSYYDDKYAAGTKFGGVVAPPLFPMHAVTRVGPNLPDPFEGAANDPDFDGVPRSLMKTWVPLPIPLKRILNGGNQVELYQNAKPGERVKARSKYTDIYQKDGKSGPMVFWFIEITYTNESEELLMKATMTRIMR